MSQTTLPRPPRPRPSEKNEEAPVQPTETLGGPEAFAAASESNPGAPAGKGSRRRVVLVIVGIVAVIAAIAATIYLINAEHYETTDDAYLEGHVVPISAEVAARVASVQVDDNQLVKKGDVIVRLDPTDYEVALEQAKASLASFEGKLTEAKAQVPAMSASRDEARAELDAAQTNFANVDADLKRYVSLDERARSKQQIDNATAAQKSAKAQVAQAQAKLTLAESQIATADAAVVAAQGDVAKASSDVKRAEVNLGYCTILAPEAGRVTRKAVEPGAYLSVGQTLLAIVPDEIWVVANFKETQLNRMRVGQPVTVTVDAYGGRSFNGHIDSIQSGTGSRFSALPAENATGNYVKIVQRVPVKIVLDPGQMNDSWMLLAPGMSVEPRVKVR